MKRLPLLEAGCSEQRGHWRMNGHLLVHRRRRRRCTWKGKERKGREKQVSCVVSGIGLGRLGEEQEREGEV